MGKVFKINERVYLDDSKLYFGLKENKILIIKEIKEKKSEIFIRPRTKTNAFVDITIHYKVTSAGCNPKKLFIDTYYMQNMAALKN